MIIFLSIIYTYRLVNNYRGYIRGTNPTSTMRIE
uniref:Uncharacterized protein n=1 Tax=Arundo donax TaxID=35708 RepID=A0A0A8YYU6_ARUDO